MGISKHDFFEADFVKERKEKAHEDLIAKLSIALKQGEQSA